MSVKLSSKTVRKRVLVRRKKKLALDDEEVTFRSSFSADEMPAHKSRVNTRKEVKLFCDNKSDDSDTSTSSSDSSSAGGTNSKRTTLKRYAKTNSDTSYYITFFCSKTALWVISSDNLPPKKFLFRNRFASLCSNFKFIYQWFFYVIFFIRFSSNQEIDKQ